MTNQIIPDFSGSVRSLPSEPKEMLSVIPEGSGHIVRINSSSLSLIQTCARKAKFVLHDKWQSKAGSPPLIFGSAIHKAMEVFYQQPRDERGEVPAYFEEIAQTMAHGHEAPEKHFLFDCVKAFVEAAEPLRGLPDTDKRSLTSGIWTLSHYFKNYISDTYVTYRDEQGPLIERKFETVLIDRPNIKVVLFGNIDLILQNTVTGHVLPADHKTASQMGNDFLSRIKPNHQYTGYLVGAQRTLGLQTEDFLINGIQVKPRPLTSRGGPPTFIRQITKRSAEDIEEFIEVVDFAVQDYLLWLRTGRWPLGSVDACAMWGGCGFHDVCAAPTALRQNILEAKYLCGTV